MPANDWLSAGANLVGGIFGADQARSDNRKNRALQEWLFKENSLLQREFAQNGIQWRVQDAEKAGIHPLAALGGGGASFSPISIDSPVDHSMADFYRDAGQNIGRAISSTETENERRLRQLQIEGIELDLENKMLENMMKASELHRMGNSPAFPGADNFIPGQGDSGASVKVEPSKRTASQPGRLAQEAGWRPDVSYSRTDTGLAPMIPEGLSESLEDDFIGKLMWRMRNQLIPNISGKGSPPKSQLPKGYDRWDWSYIHQEWRPAKGKKKGPINNPRFIPRR